MIPARPLTSQGPTGSQPSQAQAGSLAGVGPTTGPAEAAVESTEPVFAVVKGEPTPEELAALAAVVLSLGQGEPAAPVAPGVRHWVRRQQLRLPAAPGPDAWRRSRG